MTSAHGRRPGRAERDVPAANIPESWRGVGKFASPVCGALHGPSHRHRKVLQTSPDEAGRNGPTLADNGRFPRAPLETCSSVRSLLLPFPAIESGALRRGRLFHRTSRRYEEGAVKKIAGTTLVAFGVMGLVAFGVGSASAVTYTGTLTCADGGLTGVFMLDNKKGDN
jgi:hypothetical protein